MAFFSELNLDLIENNTTTVDSTTKTPVELEGYISDEHFWYINLLLSSTVGQLMAIFGMVTNIINVIIFINLGYKEPMNVSLTALSCADFLANLFYFWMNLCLTPGFNEADLPFDQDAVYYLIGAWPHNSIVNVSFFITASVTIERCLCVTFPLKVKDLITTKRIFILTILIYVFGLSVSSPAFYINRLEFIFVPERNKTILTLTFIENRQEIELPYIIATRVVLHFVDFFIILTTTVILVYVLNKKAKWRQKTSNRGASSENDSKQLKSKDVRTTKMVSLISTLFIVCMTPSMVGAIIWQITPGFYIGGRYENYHNTFALVTFFSEAINASFNIVIYYTMSSNYRAMFDRIILKKITEQEKK